MATYNYIDKNGNVKQVNANSTTEAQNLATDRQSGSGFQLVSGGNDISKSQNNRLAVGDTSGDAEIAGGGASGRFDGLNEEEAGQVDELYNYASGFGTPSSEIGDFYNDPNYRTPAPPPISAEESRIFGRQFGGGGSEFAGLTRGEAEAKAAAKGQKINAQLSPYTTYSFNQETTSGAKRIFDGFSLKLNENNNNPFNGNGSKADFTKGLLESTANDFAKLFSDQESFNNEVANNLEFKNTIDNFVKQGGNINSITSRIVPPATMQDQNAIQDVATYLNSLSPNATPAQKEAFNSLIPEKELAQNQIMSLAQIPKDLKDLYFGTPEKIGLIEEKRIQAEEYKKVLAKKAQDAEDDARTQANLVIEQNNADLEIESSKIEENRLKAKNYMTGMLAKMGALNTTGTAVQSLGILDQKYEQQAQTLRTKVAFANKNIQSKLTEVVHNLENEKEDQIYTLQSDLTKDKETVIKEIFKVQQSTAKEIFGVMSKYTTALRVQTDKYAKEQKAEAEKYAKEYAKTVQKYNVKKVADAVTIKDITSTKGKSAFKNSWSAKLEQSKDIGAEADGQYSDPAVYLQAFNDWVAKGGTIKDFKLVFPPADYINPANNTIDIQFRTTPKKSAAQIKAEDDDA